MATIGIVTIWGNFNYGNRLQNYAVERLVEQLGHNPLTLLPQNRMPLIRKMKAGLSERVRTPGMQQRKKNFDLFNSECMHGVPFGRQETCDAFLCGSDQIWNYSFPEFSESMFLTFSGDRPTASIAASFGVDSIPEFYQPVYSQGLSHIDRISVREEAGAHLVKQLSNKDALILADPTMALEASDWRTLSLQSIIEHPEHYALTYFLGNRPEGIKGIVSELFGLNEIVALNDVSCREFYSIDPRQFVALLDGADVVLTDSFHGAVFSILLQKRFVVFERASADLPMGSRLETLLSKFGLKANLVHEPADIHNCREPDSATMDILDEERAKIRSFVGDFLLEA